MLVPHGHEIYQTSFKHPVSSRQVNHSAQRNNEILTSFPRGKLTHNISSSTFAVLYLLQNACKMSQQVTCYHHCPTVILFVLTPCGVVMVLCASMSDIPGHTKSDSRGFLSERDFAKHRHLARRIRFLQITYVCLILWQPNKTV